jgi:S-DNA-T family DNA segregation ATPase FtsK/SpoIIIE
MLGKSSRRCAVSKPVRKPLAPRVSALLREVWWLAAVGLALYLGMILLTYHIADPGWSRIGGDQAVLNAGGPFGAWLSDLLLYLFGASTWLLVVLSLFFVWWGYRRIGEQESEHQNGVLITLTGFLLVLLSSSTLEAMRFHSLPMQLPLTTGGALGDSLSHLVQGVFGFDGGTVLLLLTWGAGFSLFTGISWLALAEKVGAGLEALFKFLVDTWQAKRDRKAGLEATSERDESVRQERKRMRKEPPIRIEAPVAVIEKSERVQEERQDSLFRDAPDTLRPPLRLLDEPTQNTAQVDQASLEATSRLIERKLREFGVEVKVLAAYPGPVITRYEVEPASGVKGSQITNLAKDLARALSLVSIRVVETIPGKNCMGLELPNSQRQVVRLSEILSAKVYNDNASPLLPSTR